MLDYFWKISLKGFTKDHYWMIRSFGYEPFIGLEDDNILNIISSTYRGFVPEALYLAGTIANNNKAHMLVLLFNEQPLYKELTFEEFLDLHFEGG